ncbi:ion channel [uncultured Cyclobacterium sp.]|uniref:ion channel n=1 Tax=uncultured Cyclobacterium sp. TaxID=453820 RepID=UPI0030EE8D93
MMTYKINTGNFLKQLLKRMRPALLLVAIVALVYVYLMQFVDHALSWVPYIVIFLTFIKSGYFTFFTFRQVNKSIKQCHSFGQLLWIFGLLVMLIIFSYAADFTCLVAANPSSFKGFKPFESFNYFEYLFETFYFSVVTFAAIGYGDIVPITTPAKILVMMEIGQSFVVVVFGFSNLKNIQNSNKSQ